jgi:hypothetical protein
MSATGLCKECEDEKYKVKDCERNDIMNKIKKIFQAQ